MTDQQSIENIAMLLMRYPGVSSAFGCASYGGQALTYFRFRCGDFSSLKAISTCAVAANVVITVGNHEQPLCGEAENVRDSPFDVKIHDDDPAEGPPTDTQIFGVFLARNLKKSGLVDGETADQLQRGWNALPM